eukprot:g18012.t1
MVSCIRTARRWTPAAVFRLYTSLELRAESERQATQLWEEGFEFEQFMPNTKEAPHASSPRVVFENALTESGFLGLAKDLGLLTLPFATHTGLVSLFRQYASNLTKNAALQSRAKGLFSWLSRSSDVERLGKEDIARLLDALGLPRIVDKDAVAYTFADGTWDFHGFSRHLHHEHWISKVDVEENQWEATENKSSSEAGDASVASSSGVSDTSPSSESLDLDSSVSGSSTGSLDSADGSAEGGVQEKYIGMKRDGFEKAIQELACTVRPAGKGCECEGCAMKRMNEAELDRQAGTHMEKEMEASAAQDVFGATWFSPGAWKALCRNEQMLREIFLTLLGRQGDRDATTNDNSSRGGARSQPDDDTTVLKGLRADCRISGFSHVWERAVTAEQGRVGYLEVLRFCWDYGLHPGIPNNGEDNFLLAHLFVGAAHSNVVRVVPDQHEALSLRKSNGSAAYAKLRCEIPDKVVNNWLADHKLDQVTIESEHPVLTPLLAKLTVGGGKVSRAKVCEFVEEFNIGLDRGLSPGELYMIVREIERSIREAGIGDVVTIQSCLRAVARTCIFTEAVASLRLSYGEFTSLFGALSQLQPGLNPAWCRAALYGITRQSPAAVSAVMEMFMAKIERMHLLLSKDAVRKEMEALWLDGHGCQETIAIKGFTRRFPTCRQNTRATTHWRKVSTVKTRDQHTHSSSFSSSSADESDADDSDGGDKPGALLGKTRTGGKRCDQSVRQKNVAQDLDAILRAVFDRYAALEGSGPGFPETLREGDTNIFPALSFESIAATAAKELAGAKPISTFGNEPKVDETKNGQNGDSSRLDVDGFVRVCLQLMRDNFLAKAMGFYHRVEVLTDMQRAQEWEKRHPTSTEPDDLLQRLRAWMEHYRLPSRMSPFKRETFAIGCPTETRPLTGGGTPNDGSGGGGMRTQKKRLRAPGIVPHPGPCLIDLWTGQMVARNAETESASQTSSSSGKTVKVDDIADRAVLNQITHVMVDRAIPTTTPIASASAPRVSPSIDAEECQSPLEPPVDASSPVGEVNTEGAAPAVREDDPEKGRAAIDRDNDGVHDSDTACSGSASDARDSPEDADGKPHLQVNGERASSNVDGSEALDEADSRGERASGGGIIRRNATSPPSKKQSTPTGLARKAEACWQGQMTAREVARKVKAHHLHVSNEVVRILGKIRPETTALTAPLRSNTGDGPVEETLDPDGVGQGDEDENSSGSDTSSSGSTDRDSDIPAPILTPDDYTTLPSTHPSQQLLKAGRELLRLQRPEQAVVVWGQAVEMLRKVVRVDPRQSLVGLLRLSSTLQKLGRFRDALPMLLEAQEAARIIGCWQERNRLFQNRRLEATVTGVLGWAYVKAGEYERALGAFRGIDKRLRGVPVNGPTGVKAGPSQTSPTKRKNEEAVKQEQDRRHPRTRQDIELSWEARRGCSTALVGLGRGGEALAEAEEAMELAGQLAAPAIRAETEGLMGRAWRGIAAKIGQEARRRQASMAFDALREIDERHDEDKKNDTGEKIQGAWGCKGQNDDGSTRLQDQDSRNEPDNTVKIRDKSLHHSTVTNPEGEGKAPSGIGRHIQNLDITSTGVRHSSPTGKDDVEEPRAAGDLGSHDETSSQRKAAACFKRQVTLLKSFDRFSAPVPQLEPELDFTVGDDGFSASSTKTARAKTTTKRELSNTQNFHVAALRALLELGQTTLSLGEVDSAVEVFQRRLRLADSRCPRPATPSAKAAPGAGSPVLQVGPKALPRKYRKNATFRLPTSARHRLPATSSKMRDEPGLGGIRGGSVRDEEEPMTRHKGPGFATGCSAVVRDDSGICWGSSFDPATDPFMTAWQNEEAADGLMHGGLLWRESGFGRETELGTEGVPQGIAEACGPVVEYLQRQLSIAAAASPAEGASSFQLQRRKHEAIRDALMGLGTVTLLCGDHKGGRVLYERAAHCCRSSGDWFGVANAYAANARLLMATGYFEEAIGGFHLALKLACELRDDTLAASIHSFLGWTKACQGDPKKALDHFRLWRKKAFGVGDSASVAASELCVAHMHLRLGYLQSGEGGNNDHQRRPPSAPQTDYNHTLQSGHVDLSEARRYYRRYLRWAGAMRDPCGISHAHACLARVHQAMGDEEASEQHRNASLDQCRRRGDIDNQGKMRAQEHEGVLRGMLQLN